MMNGSWAWWGLGALLMVLYVLVLDWMMGQRHAAHGSNAGESQHGHRASENEIMLVERLADAEIDIKAVQRRLSVRHRTSELDRTQEVCHEP